jgi:hypothetical protein
VTNWPLIITALSVVVVPTLLVSGLVLLSYLSTPAAPVDTVQVRQEVAGPDGARATGSVVRSAPLASPEAQRVSAVKMIEVPQAGRAITRSTPREEQIVVLKPGEEWKLPVKPVQPAKEPEKPRVEKPASVKAEADRRPRTLVTFRQASEEELLAQLEKVPELDLRARDDASARLAKAFPAVKEKPTSDKAETKESDPAGPLVAYLASRDDLAGLPLRLGGACRSSPEAAAMLGTISLTVRRLQATRDRMLVRGWSGKSPFPGSVTEEVPDRDMAAALQSDRNFQRNPRVAGPLEQMLQVDRPIVRSTLVTLLAATEWEQATQALTRRAVFDPSPLIRQDAFAALLKHPPEQARPVLLAALRHPWAPAAQHAAEVLVSLNDRAAVQDLEKLLDQDEPCAPYKDKEGKWVRKELVRVNHLRNCQLCHPLSTARTDPVRAPVPTPGKPLPELYYDRSASGLIVRADISFIKQDFSMMHRVAKPDKWPEVQRFDYFVRTRPLTAAEIKEQEASPARSGKSNPDLYPQVEAVVWALTKLKGGRK